MEPQKLETLPELLTINEAANYLRVSKFTIKRWLSSGKLKGVKLPNSHWRVFVYSCREIISK